MKWSKKTQRLAVSDCGNYEIRISQDAERGTFFNAWHLPTGKHISASHDKEFVKGVCETHAARALPNPQQTEIEAVDPS